MRSSDVLRRHNVRRTGHGETTLLFAHGFGCDQAMWRAVAPAFAETHHVVTFDYLGHGGAEHADYDPLRHATLHGYADDVLQIIEALAVGPVVFVGHSVSATIGLLAAGRAPTRFERLALVAPSPCFLDHPPEYRGGFARSDLEGLLEAMEKNFDAWAESLAPVVVGGGGPSPQSAELAAAFCRTDPRIARDFARVTFLSDHRSDVPGVPVPALVMQCSDDALAPAAVGEWLAAQLPRGTLHRMQAWCHCPHLTHPEETVAVLRAWLDAPADAPRRVPPA